MPGDLPLLVEPSWLEAELGAEDLRVYDCTTRFLPRPVGASFTESGRADYEQAHIPGAGFIDLVEDMSDPNGHVPFMAPPAERFEAAARRLGIDTDKRIVLYGDELFAVITRIWWVMKSFGLDNVAILDGGTPRWKAEGRPMDDLPCSYPASDFKAMPRPEMWADKEEVATALGRGDVNVLNALTLEQHEGGGTHYGRPGRIAGSVCVPAAGLRDPETKCYRPRGQLSAMFSEAGAEPDKRQITYCGGGIAATASAFAL
ncbi:MAG: rhodanese-like domain-containing protein, partial [Chromatiales bacterium]